MSKEAVPERLSVIWSPEARANLRAIDRNTALEILHCIDHYLLTRTGDVKRLKPPLGGFRLRCGDYRVFFDARDSMTMQITAVAHRRDAYR